MKEQMILGKISEIYRIESHLLVTFIITVTTPIQKIEFGEVVSTVVNITIEGQIADMTTKSGVIIAMNTVIKVACVL